MGSKCPSEASKAAGNAANLDCSGEIWEGNNQQSTMLPTENGDSSIRLQFFPRRSLAAVISCISAREVLVFNPIMERTNCHKRLMYHSSAVLLQEQHADAISVGNAFDESFEKGL